MAELDARGQRAWRRFAQKLQAEGGYSPAQIQNAQRYWMERYNRGVRDDAQLEQAGRVGTESIEPPSELDRATDQLTAAVEGAIGPLDPGPDGPAAELMVPGESIESLEEYLGRLKDQEGYDRDQLREAGEWWLQQRQDVAGNTAIQIPPQPGDLAGGMEADALLADIEGGAEPVTSGEFADQVVQGLPVEQQVDLTEMGWSPDAPTNEELAAIQTVTKQPDGKETVTDAVDLTQTGWKDWASLGAGLAGSALGVLAPELERDRGYEASLRRRMGGDTLARRESALAAGQLGRGIRSASLGRRDISPALAARNAQMAAAQASTDMMGRAAIASAQERRNAETELANIRKQRRATQINAGLGALSQVGAWLGGQAASERQDAKTRQAQSFQAEQNRLMREALGKGRG